MESSQGKASNSRLKSWKIPILYLFISLIWIFIADHFLQKWGYISRSSSITHLLLDSLFVLVTAGMLYGLIYRQISKERKAKELWQEREEQLRFLIDTIPDFVCYKDTEGRWVEANAYALEVFRLKGVRYKGKTDMELAQYSPFYRDALLFCYEMDQKVLQRNHPIHIEEYIPQPDGSTLVFDVVKVPTFYPDGRKKGLVVIGRNITERKEVEERYKALFDQNPDSVVSIGVNGNFLSVNSVGQQLLGYTEEEFLQLDIYDVVMEDEWEQVKAYFEQSMEGSALTYDLILKHKQGYPIDVSVKSFPIRVNQRLYGVYCIVKDMRERRQTEELLRKSDRLSLVGQLAAGVAHEVRNPLATLSGFVQLLREQAQGHEHYYQIMLSELDRINFIVNEFMLLAKPHTLHFQHKDLHQILEHVVTLANTQAIMNNVFILTKMVPDLPPIYGDENQLKQVFFNILKNSIEAMPKGGDIWVEAEKQDPGHIRLRFIDQGCGIPEDRLAKLGEPFYSTKEKGMGLGLMMSYRIIEAHHGRMSFSSEIGKGTIVEVVLPLNGETEGLKKLG